MVAEPLLQTQFFKCAHITLPHGKPLLGGNCQTLVDDLSVKLVVRGEGDVLLLHRGVNAHVRVVRVIPIDADALLEDEFNALLANAVAEMYQFG
jgi:hypothetical protein